MHKMMASGVALLALAGCASAPDQAPAAPRQQVAAHSGQGEDDTPLTGSRLAKRKSTDRLLKSVGNSDARDALDSAPDPLKSGQ